MRTWTITFYLNHIEVDDCYLSCVGDVGGSTPSSVSCKQCVEKHNGLTPCIQDIEDKFDIEVCDCKYSSASFKKWISKDEGTFFALSLEERYLRVLAYIADLKASHA